MRGARPTWVLGLVIVSLAQAGCMIESRYEDGQLVSRAIGLGVARLPDCDPSKSTLVSTSALGAGLGRDRLQLGYVHSEYVCIPKTCKAVFWVDDPGIVDDVRALIGDDEHLCMASREGEAMQ